MKIEEKVELALSLVKEMPKDLHPRIGGSCALYIQGQVNGFDDIDIILDDIEHVSLPYPMVPPKHPKKMNKVISYLVRGVKVDLITRITPLVATDKEFVEPVEIVRTAMSKLYRYCLTTYKERVKKWECNLLKEKTK